MIETYIPEVLSEQFTMLIGGQSVVASDQGALDTTNPATTEKITSFPNATRVDVDAAVAAASNAQPEWAGLNLLERQNLLKQVADVLRQNTEQWGQLDCLENGNVYSAMSQDAAGGAGVLDYFIAIANEVKGEATQLDHNLHYTRCEPFGVVARLLPFNHPIQSLGSALGAPLLMGNTLVLKPSPHTSLSALSFGAAIKDIVPPGVINVISGSNENVALRLMQHPEVPRLSVTGSTEVGRLALREGAQHLKTITLELGGKTPMIIFDDADIDLAVDTAVRGMNLKWQGHSCSSTSRVLAHASIYQAFVSRLATRFEQVVVGDPFDMHSEMGPISHRDQFNKVRKYIKSGLQQGARLVCGGKRLAEGSLGKGYFMTPAVFAEVTPSMRIAREEIYGPVISVIEWQDEAEAIAIANDIDYGLAAVIMTTNLDRAHRTAHLLHAGYVEINGPVSFALGSPFGGVKHSGTGREGTIEELISYTQTKSVNVQLRKS